LIPLHELLGVTVVLLTCSYRSQEFFRVGYYVNNDYSDPELCVWLHCSLICDLFRRENPPETVDINLIGREISIAEPRVTKVPIEWDDVVEEGAGMGNADEQQLGVPEGLLDDENSRSLGVE
jgi:histone chaperone ASF1